MGYEDRPGVLVVKWVAALVVIAIVGGAVGIIVGSKTNIPKSYTGGLVQHEFRPTTDEFDNIRGDLEAIDLRLTTIDGRVIVIEGLVDRMRIAREREDAVKEYIESQK